MPPLNPINAWDDRGIEATRQVARRFFFLCEGRNTERWYFTELFAILSKMDLPGRAELVYVDRTDEDENISAPKRLAEYADKVRNNDGRDYGYDESSDKTVIVFDAERFRSKEQELERIICDIEQNNIIGVTQPSFELYLLLHMDEAYEQYILPHSAEILEDRKRGKRRYIDRLFSEECGINPKTNETGVRALAHKHDIAIAQERNINHDVHKVHDRLTSNIGEIIDNIKQGE